MNPVEKETATLQRLKERKQDRDKETNLPAIQAQIKALTRWGTDPLIPDLSKITHPVLIIQGDDEMMDSASSHELYKRIPNSVLTSDAPLNNPQHNIAMYLE
jgi:esterase/lipase